MARFLSRLIIVQVGWIAATLVMLVAFCFLAVAAYLGLREVTSAPIAMLICGLVTLLIAVVIGFVTYLTASKLSLGTRRGQSRATGEAGPGGEAGLLIGEALLPLIRAHPQRAAAISLIAGLIVGVSPRLRRMLQDLL